LVDGVAKNQENILFYTRALRTPPEATALACRVGQVMG